MRLNLKISVIHGLYTIIFFTAMLVYPIDTSFALPITKSFGFSAYNFFSPIGTATPPQDPVFGNFTVTYDSEVDIIGGKLDDIDLNIDGYSYNINNTGFNYDSTFDNLFVGGILNGINGTGAMNDDFLLSFRATTLSPSFFASFGYVTASTPSDNPIFLADTRIAPSNVIISENPVPEPASFLLLSAGLAVIGFNRYRSKRIA